MMHAKMSLKLRVSHEDSFTHPRPEFLVEFEYVHDVEVILGRVRVMLSQVLPFSFVYMLHVCKQKLPACPVLWLLSVCAVWDEQKRGGLRSLCCVTQGLLSCFHDEFINSTE